MNDTYLNPGKSVSNCTLVSWRTARLLSTTIAFNYKYQKILVNCFFFLFIFIVISDFLSLVSKLLNKSRVTLCENNKIRKYISLRHGQLVTLSYNVIRNLLRILKFKICLSIEWVYIHIMFNIYFWSYNQMKNYFIK